jgi:nitroreductase
VSLKSFYEYKVLSLAFALKRYLLNRRYHMEKEIIGQKNAILDEIINARRSHRNFKQDVPSKNDIYSIINAGLHAPFAAAVVGDSDDYFRRFFVVTRDSKIMKNVASIVFDELTKMSSNLENAMKNDSELNKQASWFANRLAMIKKMGKVPGVGTAPYFIIVAEKKGFPSVEQQSIAHCLENMWLKATALGLGFQLVSVTAQMENNPKFCELLGIKLGEWALDGCAIGYSAEELSPSVRPSVEKVTKWFE